MSSLTLDQIREIGNFPEIDMYSRIAFKDALIRWNEKQTPAVSELSQSLPENVQGPNMLGADDRSGKSNAVMDAYNAYQERERQAWAKLFGGH
jgi:hypothetical protein